ncbi:MAG: helix-hairpin-helix domain-containing protein [Pseudomonadota bacterium]
MNLKNFVLVCVAALLLGLGHSVAASDAVAADIVNINDADAKTLAAVLDGVGLKRAEAIVIYRQENGRFYSAEELTAIRGIGKSTVEKNQERIVVE